MNQRKSYSADEINKITESVSVLDYFQYLEKQGKVQFDRKSGHDYYFRTDENKFSVNENGYYDFKTGQGGKIIKAVMNFENKSWRETMDFLKDFSNVYISEDFAEQKRLKDTQSNEKSNISVTKKPRQTMISLLNILIIEVLIRIFWRNTQNRFIIR